MLLQIQQMLYCQLFAYCFIVTIVYLILLYFSGVLILFAMIIREKWYWRDFRDVVWLNCFSRDLQHLTMKLVWSSNLLKNESKLQVRIRSYLTCLIIVGNINIAIGWRVMEVITSFFSWFSCCYLKIVVWFIAILF